MTRTVLAVLLFVCAGASAQVLPSKQVCPRATQFLWREGDIQTLLDGINTSVELGRFPIESDPVPECPLNPAEVACGVSDSA